MDNTQKKRGRPTLSDDIKKNEHVRVKMSKDEKTELTNKAIRAGYKSVSRWLRDIAHAA